MALAPHAKTPAGELGLTGDRSIAFSMCVASCGYNVRTFPFAHGLLAAQNEVIAVDHFGAARVAQD
jgi:hypothetical protein